MFSCFGLSPISFHFVVKFKITKSICQIDFSVGYSEVNSVSYYSALSHEIERFMPKKILRHQKIHLKRIIRKKKLSNKF